jgi:integrase/recombinase XerD
MQATKALAAGSLEPAARKGKFRRVTQGKGQKDRSVLFPMSFRGELAQYMERQRTQGARYLFESNRHRPYSTRRIRQLVKQYALAAGIAKRVYPHLFRHQLIT